MTPGPWTNVEDTGLIISTSWKPWAKGAHIAQVSNREDAVWIVAVPDMLEYIEARAKAGDEKAQAILAEYG